MERSVYVLNVHLDKILLMGHSLLGASSEIKKVKCLSLPWLSSFLSSPAYPISRVTSKVFVPIKRTSDLSLAE